MSKKPVAKRESKKPAPKRRPAAKRRTLSERVRDLERRVDRLQAEAPGVTKSRSVVDLIGTWSGDDLDELLRMVKATRSRARF